MTQNPNALAAARYEPPHPAENPDRVAFMAALDKHEDALAELLAFGAGDLRTETLLGQARSVEQFRMSRRAIVAAYDKACLTVNG